MSRLPGLGDAAVIRAVHQIARRQDAQVLHGHGAKGGAYARLAARALKREGRQTVSIYTPHGGSLHYPPTSAPGMLYLAIEKFLARYTDGLIFESDYMRRLYEQRVGAQRRPDAGDHQRAAAGGLRAARSPHPMPSISCSSASCGA